MEWFLSIVAKAHIGKTKSANLAVVITFLFLTGCASLPQAFRQALTVVIPHEVDFVEIEYYAKRSDAAYKPASQIRREFPLTTRVKTVTSVNVRYFVETDPSHHTQTVSVRGTANKQNVWQDEEISLVKDKILNVNLHKGFQDDAKKTYADLKGHLKKGYSIRLTGHSLGGAIAAIVTWYLTVDGYKVTRLVTFGQPKITDDAGKNAKHKTTRVAHDTDVVAMLPPTGLVFKYKHIGPELILRDGPEYVFLDRHDAGRLSIGQFWRNLTNFSTEDHHMDSYLKNIQEKIRNGAKQVPYFGPSNAKATAN